MTIAIDPARIAQLLRQDAMEAMSTAEGHLTLDFSAVTKIDSAGVQALEQLAASAESRSVQLVLHGVSVQLYKVLRLLNLTRRFALN
ncbi:MAG TPA: STAS domain-containing protein [Candidatus Sulfopaludibacter sp.]|jgi:anti-anti-sigma regulatory factor|nr:STAS domain-containing protein [Candidatus Sulfopaludibacter sp.]